MSIHELIPAGRSPIVPGHGRYEPNVTLDGRLDYFIGRWPMERFDKRPRDGQSVVYFLWTDDWSELLYVGSTMHFYQRMKQHREKPFGRWEAWPFETREQAYRFEARYLQKCMPILNKRRETIR